MPLCRERCYLEDRNEPLCRERCYPRHTHCPNISNQRYSGSVFVSCLNTNIFEHTNYLKSLFSDKTETKNTYLFDKTERKKWIYGDKTETNNPILPDKTERKERAFEHAEILKGLLLEYTEILKSEVYPKKPCFLQLHG